jgi:hypothetical protein
VHTLHAYCTCVPSRPLRTTVVVFTYVVVSYCGAHCRYSLVWYSWGDWQEFIDWMSLSGINLYLAMTGQEEVLYCTVFLFYWIHPPSMSGTIHSKHTRTCAHARAHAHARALAHTDAPAYQGMGIARLVALGAVQGFRTAGLERHGHPVLVQRACVSHVEPWAERVREQDCGPSASVVDEVSVGIAEADP